MSLKVSALPLDDRPCNTEQLSALAEIAGLSLSLPPLALIGTHSPDFKIQKVWDWAEREFKSADIFIISVEMLCFGGLVRSRKTAPPDQPERAIKNLKKWMGENPRVKVFVSNVLLRLSITVAGKASEEDWKNIFRYSVLNEGPRSPQEEKEWTSLQAKIPHAVLDEYLAVRKRNHQINLKIAELVPHASYTLFGQEDCGPRGLHREEKRSLQKKLEHLEAKATVLTGADELQAMLLARALSDRFKAPEALLYAEWSDPKGAHRVSNYEDISAVENLALHVHPLALKLSPGSAKDPRAIALKIFSFPESGQQDICFLENISAAPLNHPEFLKSLRPGEAFLDLSFANGASDAVMRELSETLHPLELRSFSAWNTTGNRLGTLLSHLSISETARFCGCFNDQADLRYRALRLADDWIYQGRVRARINQSCQARGLSTWALGENKPTFSAECANEMEKELKKAGLPEFEASLPWPRTFEVSLKWLGFPKEKR
jgi:hypothetical protein